VRDRRPAEFPLVSPPRNSATLHAQAVQLNRSLRQFWALSVLDSSQSSAKDEQPTRRSNERCSDYRPASDLVARGEQHDSYDNSDHRRSQQQNDGAPWNLHKSKSDVAERRQRGPALRTWPNSKPSAHSGRYGRCTTLVLNLRTLCQGRLIVTAWVVLGPQPCTEGRRRSCARPCSR
jgi:hypothetical protein